MIPFLNFILLQIKQVCRELVAKWSRPIFGLNDNFSSVSREAREQRDFELLPKQKKKRLKDATEKNEDKEEEEADNVWFLLVTFSQKI